MIRIRGRTDGRFVLVGSLVADATEHIEGVGRWLSTPLAALQQARPTQHNRPSGISGWREESAPASVVAEQHRRHALPRPEAQPPVLVGSRHPCSAHAFVLSERDDRSHRWERVHP